MKSCRYAFIVGTGASPISANVRVVPSAITREALGHTIPCRSGELASPVCLMPKKVTCLCISEHLFPARGDKKHLLPV